MTEQRTLVLVKPDGVKGQHIGDIITRIEHKGYQIAALKVIQATKEQLEAHYEDKVNAPFFPELFSYMQEGPLVGVIVTGTNVVSIIHRMAGATNPSQADWGTVRGDFGREWPDGNLRNVIHTSDSPSEAEREISIWFPEEGR